MSVLRSLRPDRYADLPEAARLVVSRAEFAWLPEREKARLVEDLCMPDWAE